jgi:hypothetical protein
MKSSEGKLVITKIVLSDKDFELKEGFVKKMKKREKMSGFAVGNLQRDMSWNKCSD